MDLSKWNPFKFTRKGKDETASKDLAPASPSRPTVARPDPFAALMQDMMREPFFVEPSDPALGPQAAYHSEIRYVDQYIERLYEHFAWDENTLLVVLSDHGEEFGDHGQHGHLFSLHRELTQVSERREPRGRDQ